MFDHLHPDLATLRRTRDTLRTHLARTLETRTGHAGLDYLPAPSDYRYTLESSDPVQLLVIGGSRTESVLYRPDTGEYTDHRHHDTPVLSSAETLAGLVRSLHAGTGLLVVNFTFPMRPHLRGDTLDGTLLRGTKQHTLDNLCDQDVGAYLESHLPNTRVLLLNDITTLLCAFAPQDIRLAGVLGTGSNFGVAVDGQFVNLETGNYRDFDPDPAVRTLDSLSDNPGQQLWEKSISGKYLRDHFNYYAKQAGLETRATSSRDLDTFDDPTDQDLALAIHRRSAARCAATIAALLEVTQTERLVMEGSVFWAADHYYSFVQEYLRALGHAHVSVIESNRPFVNLTSILTTT